MADRVLHRVLVGALWGWWLAGVVPWICLSWYEADVHHDDGSWIGGGAVMAVFLVLVLSLLGLVRYWWKGKEPRG